MAAQLSPCQVFSKVGSSRWTQCWWAWMSCCNRLKSLVMWMERAALRMCISWGVAVKRGGNCTLFVSVWVDIFWLFSDCVSWSKHVLVVLVLSWLLNRRNAWLKLDSKCYGLETWHKSDQCTEIDEQICFILSHLSSVLPRLVIELFLWLCNPTWTPDGTVDPCGTWAEARLSVLMCIYCNCMPGANRAFSLSIEKTHLMIILWIYQFDM